MLFLSEEGNRVSFQNVAPF